MIADAEHIEYALDFGHISRGEAWIDPTSMGFGWKCQVSHHNAAGAICVTRGATQMQAEARADCIVAALRCAQRFAENPEDRRPA